MEKQSRAKEYQEQYLSTDPLDRDHLIEMNHKTIEDVKGLIDEKIGGLIYDSMVAEKARKFKKAENNIDYFKMLIKAELKKLKI